MMPRYPDQHKATTDATLCAIDRMIARSDSEAERKNLEGLKRLFCGDAERDQLTAEMRDAHLEYIEVYERALAVGFFTPSEGQKKLYGFAKRMVRGDLDPNLEEYE